MTPPPVGRVWFRDRFIVVGLLLLVTAATWYYTVDMARMMTPSGSASHAMHEGMSHEGMSHEGMSGMSHEGMSGMSHEGMSGMSHEGMSHDGHAMGLHGLLSPHHEHMGAFGLIMMWVIMMVAMMLPSAIPVTVMHARLLREKDSNPRVRSLLFALGYVVVWGAFSIAAAVVQIVLERSSVVSAAWMRFERVEVGAGVLIVAGLFQFSSMKNACLRQCRTPVGFLMTEWRDGTAGAVVMGIKNGLYCLGCCWALMLVLFVGGVMSMLWMLVLTLVMLLEKTAPGGQYVARGAGVVLIAAGVAQLFGLLG